MNKVKYSLKVDKDVDICIIKKIAYCFDTTQDDILKNSIRR